jgi:hypothetical protein
MILVLAGSLTARRNARASQPSEDTTAQNPVASVISIPIQGNTAFGVGPYLTALNQTLVEPVAPLRLTQNWILVATITPIVVLPRLSQNPDVKYGLGNMEPQFFSFPRSSRETHLGCWTAALPSDRQRRHPQRQFEFGFQLAANGEAEWQRWDLTQHGHWFGGLLLSKWASEQTIGATESALRADQAWAQQNSSERYQTIALESRFEASRPISQLAPPHAAGRTTGRETESLPSHPLTSITPPWTKSKSATCLKGLAAQ